MKTENITALLFTALIGYLTYLILAPFFVPIFWAVVFVIIFYPYYIWLLKVLKGKNIASLVACITIALFFVVPMAIIAATMADEVLVLYQRADVYISNMSTHGHGTVASASSYIQGLLGRYVDISTADLQNIAVKAVKEASGYMVEGAKGAIKNFAQFFFNLFLAFFTMFFLFVESDRLVGVLKDIIPLAEEDKEQVLAKNRVVITATITGGVLVGAVQGALGGGAFWVLGISSPILWGFVMFVMSFLPGIGTSLVIVPAVIYLFIIGSAGKAVLLLIWGAVVIGLADNILRPLIVSGKTKQHPMLLFLSVIGAVHAFGLIGIIAGPVIISVAQGGLDIYRSAAKERRAHGP
ncbi:MAG: AI-2E family transporter [Thermodesulfobacteriota bacterium]|nr:MAG: AI-2E family transporter [Thermodesulfobacteriota bacterium]